MKEGILIFDERRRVGSLV